jgi:hypothetical protein
VVGGAPEVPDHGRWRGGVDALMVSMGEEQESTGEGVGVCNR